MWLHSEIIKKLVTDARVIFPTVKYAFTTIPTYPCGQIGFVVASKDGTIDVSSPTALRVPDKAMAETLKYYSTEVHNAAFVLPIFTKKLLDNP